MLTLYHAEPLANSMRVILCLKEKGLAFESRYVNLLKFEQHEPAFLAINPDGQVPVLDHDGAVITQCTVIDEYLEDVFPEVALRPADPLARARMREWTKFVDDRFCPALSLWGWQFLVRRVAQAVPKDEFERLLERVPLKAQRDKWAAAAVGYPEDELADAKATLQVSVARMEARLGDAPWLAGEGYSLADVHTYSMAAGTARLFPELMNETTAPRAMEWLARMDARPAVQEARAMPNETPETLRALGVEL